MRRQIFNKGVIVGWVEILDGIYEDIWKFLNFLFINLEFLEFIIVVMKDIYLFNIY